jgi:hypothetical protein
MVVVAYDNTTVVVARAERDRDARVKMFCPFLLFLLSIVFFIEQ